MIIQEKKFVDNTRKKNVVASDSKIKLTPLLYHILAGNGSLCGLYAPKVVVGLLGSDFTEGVAFQGSKHGGKQTFGVII